MTVKVTEQLTFEASAEGEGAKPGGMLVQLISPGWGSSGYYSDKVLENAADDKVWPKGTHIYFDHPTESEQMDRPVRSVRDLAAVLTEDAYRVDGGALWAKANIIGPYRDLLTDPVFQESVGMSIRASCEMTQGEAAGRRGPIVSRLVEGMSVDIVTKAGRGGKILAALESARGEASEATTDDIRDRLSRLFGEHSYVSDFDPDTSTVYYSQRVDRGEDGYRRALFSQGYTLTETGATLEGEPTEVRAYTTYVPVESQNTVESAVKEHPKNPPVNPAGSITESKEDTMADIEESRLAQLEEDAGRAQEAEQRTTVAEQRATAAENRSSAVEAIMESGFAFTKLERKGLLADLPLTAEGALDAEKFSESLQEQATESSTGRSGVRGLGDVIEEGDAASIQDYQATFGQKGA